MSEINGIIELLKRTFEGPAWHGPSLMEVIEKIDPDMPAETPGRHHSPVELLNHIIFWREGALKMLRGEEVNAELDWKSSTQANGPEWQKMISRLKESQAELITEAGKLPIEKLNENLPGKDFSYYVLLHGVIQHDIYHAGQIKLISLLQS